MPKNRPRPNPECQPGKTEDFSSAEAQAEAYIYTIKWEIYKLGHSEQIPVKVIEWGPLYMSRVVFVNNFVLQVTARPLPTYISIQTVALVRNLS